MKITKITYNSIRRLNVNYHNKESVLQFNKNINIFIGENGSGKSTVIDMIRSLVHPQIISSLPKENPLSRTIPYYAIEFDNKTKKIVQLTSAEKNRPDNYIHCKIIENNRTVFEHDIHKFDQIENLEIFKKEKLTIQKNVHYRPYLSHSIDKPTEQYINEINLIRNKLSGLFDREKNDFDKFGIRPLNTENFFIARDNLVSVWLEEDTAMPNNIHLSWLPSGWRSFAEVTSFLLSCENNSICLLEEPEINLHPKLQRLLVKRVEQISIDKNLQIFMSTHSAVMINSSLSSSVEVFHTRGGYIETLGHQRQLLDDLGYKASDIFQANFVIWVEGPSDRIYIKHWLSGIDNTLIEGIDYSFLFYGGKILSHFGLLSNEDDLISILRININSMIVIDSDKASPDQALNETKERIKKGCSEGFSNVWITSGREIENYLELNTLKKSISNVHKNFKEQVKTDKWSNVLKYRSKSDSKIKTANKVRVAKEYIRECSNTVIYTDELKKSVSELADLIVNARN